MRKLVTVTQKVCDGQPIGQQIKDSLKNAVKNGASDLQAAVALKCEEMIEADNKRKQAAAEQAKADAQEQLDHYASIGMVKKVSVKA
tara:strand:+ start:233 stop:493 length:261 start_codon:yes stop_codon:yes gene_type:complete